MKQTINFHDFQKAFQDLRPNNFTYDGLRALFEYLEELDVIELCGAYNEYESVEQYHSEYSTEHDIEDHLVTTSDSGSLITHVH